MAREWIPYSFSPEIASPTGDIPDLYGNFNDEQSAYNYLVSVTDVNDPLYSITANNYLGTLAAVYSTGNDTTYGFRLTGKYWYTISVDILPHGGSYVPGPITNFNPENYSIGETKEIYEGLFGNITYYSLYEIRSNAGDLVQVFWFRETDQLITSEYVVVGSDARYPGGTLSKTGYSFTGWSPSILGYTITTSINFLAQWSQNSYTITWNSNGGSPSSSTTSVLGGEYAVPPINVIKEGYTISSWSPDPGTTLIGSNLTFTAQWVQNLAKIFLPMFSKYSVNKVSSNIESSSLIKSLNLKTLSGSFLDIGTILFTNNNQYYCETFNVNDISLESIPFKILSPATNFYIPKPNSLITYTQRYYGLGYFSNNRTFFLTNIRGLIGAELYDRTYASDSSSSIRDRFLVHMQGSGSGGGGANRTKNGGGGVCGGLLYGIIKTSGFTNNDFSTNDLKFFIGKPGIGGSGSTTTPTDGEPGGEVHIKSVSTSPTQFVVGQNKFSASAGGSAASTTDGSAGYPVSNFITGVNTSSYTVLNPFRNMYFLNTGGRATDQQLFETIPTLGDLLMIDRSNPISLSNNNIESINGLSTNDILSFNNPLNQGYLVRAINTPFYINSSLYDYALSVGTDATEYNIWRESSNFERCSGSLVDFEIQGAPMIGVASASYFGSSSIYGKGGKLNDSTSATNSSVYSPANTNTNYYTNFSWQYNGAGGGGGKANFSSPRPGTAGAPGFIRILF